MIPCEYLDKLYLSTKGIYVLTASFLQKFIALENTLFANDARRQLHNIFTKYGTNIKTACQLRNAIYINFFDNL